MANFHWTGAHSTAYHDGRNWVNTAGVPYAQAVYPGTGSVTDAAYFDRAATRAVAGGDYSANQIFKMAVGALYDKPIGSSGTPLVLNVQGFGSDVIISGLAAGDVHLSGDTISYLRVIEFNPASTIYLGGTISEFMSSAGEGVITAGADIVLRAIFAQDPLRTAAEWTLFNSTVSLPGTVVVSGGTLTSGSASSAPGITTLVQKGGTFQSYGDINTVHNVMGTFEHHKGDVDEAHVGDFWDTSVSQHLRQIGHVIVYENGNIDLRNGVNGVTISSRTLLGGFQIEDYGQRYGNMILTFPAQTDIFPDETPDGTITQFTTERPFVSGTLRVYKNGILATPGVNYVEDVGLQSYTFTSAPPEGTAIQHYYTPSA